MMVSLEVCSHELPAEPSADKGGASSIFTYPQRVPLPPEIGPIHSLTNRSRRRARMDAAARVDVTYSRNMLLREIPLRVILRLA